MTTLSIRDAARQVGVSRSAIFRAIRSGKISAPRKENGDYAIDTSELFRVFEPKPMEQRDTDGLRPTGPSEQGSETAGTTVTAVTAALKAEVEALKELVRRLDKDKEDLKAERDRWAHQAERLALAAPAGKAARPWWPWKRSA
jgi:excisionase family DNA binding protein